MKAILNESFIILQILGLWKPTEGFKLFIWNWLYNIETFVIFFFVFSFTSNGLIRIIFYPGNMEEMIDVCSIILSAIGVSAKIFNVVKNHDKIDNIVEKLTTGLCKPRNKDEEMIQNKMDRGIRFFTLGYWIMNGMTVLTVSIGNQIMDKSLGITLPYGIFIPWDYSNSRLLFWIAYFYQVTSVALSANASVGFDSLSAGLIIQINAKIEILKYRINGLIELLESIQWTNNQIENYKNMKIEQLIIADYVKLAQTINSVFNWVIFLQYFISTVVLCGSIYILISTPQFAGFLFYLCVMLMEIFIFCFAGNEVTLMSNTISDAIFNSKWINVNKSCQKSLLIIMNRASRPIKFVNGNIVELSYESFKGLLKSSYSAYNVLKTT